MSKAGDILKASLGLPPSVSCEGKVPFDSRELATQVAQRAARGKYKGRQAYRCGACRKYHLGSKGGRVERRRSAEIKRRRREQDEQIANAE